MCLDDGNPSVAAAALNATEAFLAPLAREDEEEDAALQGLSWVDYQVRGAVPTLLFFCIVSQLSVLVDDNIKDKAYGEKQSHAPDESLVWSVTLPTTTSPANMYPKRAQRDSMSLTRLNPPPLNEIADR